jgi:secreted Zn-dependent insulinase-like peptidase
MQSREKVLKLSDDEFEIQKEAVLVKMMEKDLNLRMETERYWNEMTTHQFNFKR